MTKTKLNITFHNPNSMEDVIKKLVEISAEVAKKTVENELLHIQSNTNKEGQVL